MTKKYFADVKYYVWGLSSVIVRDGDRGFFLPGGVGMDPDSSKYGSNDGFNDSNMPAWRYYVHAARRSVRLC